MIRQPLSLRWYLILGGVSIVVLLIAYTALASAQKRKNPEDTTVPSWSQLASGVSQAITPHRRTGERALVVDSLATGWRLLVGLVVGVLGALLLGLLMGCFPVLEAVLSPPLTIFAKIPGTAAMAVFFVLVGTGFNMYIAMIAFGVLPSLALTVHLAVRDVPDELLNKAYTLGASHLEVIWNIIFRQILPKLIDNIRLQIGPAMVFLIAAEMLVGDEGFGYRIRLQQKKLDMSTVFFYLAVLAAFGFVIDYALRKLQRVACPWHSPEKG